MIIFTSNLVFPYSRHIIPNYNTILQGSPSSFSSVAEKVLMNSAKSPSASMSSE